MFAGTGGSGVMEMPSAHSLVMPEGCITCHMHSDKGYGLRNKGGHTFRQDDRVCLKCHGGVRPVTFIWRAKISFLLRLLEVFLDNAPDKRTKLYKAARFNYNLVVADGDIGVHNPRYAQALLIYAISSLQAELTGEQFRNVATEGRRQGER